MPCFFSEKRSFASLTNKSDRSLTLKIKFFWLAYILVINCLISKLKDVLDNKTNDVHPVITAVNMKANLKSFWKVFSNLHNHKYIN